MASFAYHTALGIDTIELPGPAGFVQSREGRWCDSIERIAGDVSSCRLNHPTVRQTVQGPAHRPVRITDAYWYDEAYELLELTLNRTQVVVSYRNLSIL